MLKNKNIFQIITILIVIGGLVVFFIFQKKIAYIDFNQVYNSFSYKKELEKDFDKVVTKRQQILDSVKYQLTIKKGSLDTTQYNSLLREYQYNTQVFENNNSILQEQYYNKIVKQINEYVLNFGEENGYDIILGANGNGSLMYGNDNINITEDVISFINNKYEGK